MNIINYKNNVIYVNCKIVQNNCVDDLDEHSKKKSSFDFEEEFDL